MTGKQKSNERNAKKQMIDLACKLVQHCQLRKLQEWMQMKTAYITKLLPLSLFPEEHDIVTYWQSHIIFIFLLPPNSLTLTTKGFLHEIFLTLIFLL